jgi:hypothetical protein
MPAAMVNRIELKIRNLYGSLDAAKAFFVWKSATQISTQTESHEKMMTDKMAKIQSTCKAQTTEISQLSQ